MVIADSLVVFATMAFGAGLISGMVFTYILFSLYCKRHNIDWNKIERNKTI